MTLRGPNLIRYIVGHALTHVVSKALTIPALAFVVYSASSWWFGTCGSFLACLGKFLLGYFLLSVLMVAILRPVLAGTVHRFARRLIVRAQQDAHRRDDRAPVLYLRRFHVDKNTKGQLAFHRGAYKSGSSLEEGFFSAFRRTGQLVALVDPKNPMDQVGAVRVEVESENWLSGSGLWPLRPALW